MIRIDTSKIEKWEEIKERHSEWFFRDLKNRLSIIISKIDSLSIEEKEFFNFINKDNNFEKIVLGDNIEEFHKIILSMKISVNWNDFLLNKIEEIIKLINNENSIDTEQNLINTQEYLNDIIRRKVSNKNIVEILEKYVNAEIFVYRNKEKNKRDRLRINMKQEVKEYKNELEKFKATYKKDKDKILDKELYALFNYNAFIDEKPPKWGRREFLNLLGLETCPYCQRAYVTNFQDNESKNTTADLDHFYPKAKYPYLALSLYNFVPSCKFCNSTGRKGDTDTFKEPHIYPYTDSMEEDIKFTIETDSFMDNIFTKNQNLNIGIDVISTDIEKNKKIQNNLKTFKLKEVYKNSHSKYVGDLIQNFQKYPKSYTKALGEIFLEDKDKESKEHQEKLQILNDNFQEIIKKPYIDKIEKGEPLAKLTKDIMEELGIK